MKDIVLEAPKTTTARLSGKATKSRITTVQSTPQKEETTSTKQMFRDINAAIPDAVIFKMLNKEHYDT